jgi:hypothetical protein
MILSLALPTAAAADKPAAAVVPLQAAGAVPAAVQKRFDQKLREAVKAHATVGDVGAAEKAAEGRCADSVCLDKVATAAKVRFVVTGQVSNADDIYKVSLTLYDDAYEKVVDASQECELCAAEEVDRSIVAAVETFKAAFAAAPPVVAPKTPPTSELVITTDPGGADVELDGKVVGKTPYKAQVTRGKHAVKVSLAGHVTEQREVDVGDRATTQDFLLQVTATPVAAAETPAEAPPAAPSAPGAAPAEHRTAGIILTVLGAVGLGVGGFLINMDGQITCESGSRKTCPDVYTTKWFGAAAMAAGGLAVGAGATVLILPKIDAPEPTAGGPRRLSGGLVFTGEF